MPLLLRACALALSAALAGGRAPAQQPAAAAFDHSHARWSAVLAACVRDGGVDYAKLKADRAGLDAYLAALHAVTPADLASWTNEQRLAFWIDVYDAHAVALALDNWPLKSIRKLDGAFGRSTVLDKPLIPMRTHHPDGKDEDLSLNDVHHKILRRRFKDARVHAALHNTGKGGPALRREAYVAEKLDAQLADAMRTFVNDPAKNRVDAAGLDLQLSQVFRWFQEDFEREGRSVAEYVARYLPEKEAQFVRATKPRFLEYDWELADASSR